MTQIKEIKELIKSTNDTLVFNEDTWSLVKSFFEERYNDFSILIEDTNENEEKFNNFDDSFKYIAENKQNVSSIRIDGVHTENSCTAKIVFRNNLKRNYSQPTILINIEHIESDYDAIDNFASKLFAQTKRPYTNSSFDYDIGLSYFCAQAVGIITGKNIQNLFENTLFMILVSITIGLLVYFIVSRLAKPLNIKNYKLPDIMFYFSKEDIRNYKNKSRRQHLIGIPLIIISIGILVAAFFM